MLENPIAFNAIKSQRGHSEFGRVQRGGIWIFAFLLIGALVPVVAFAQQAPPLDLGIDRIANILALPEGDPRAILVRIINMALGFLAIITLVLVVWGGFQYMLSGGREDAVQRAKGTITSAIIGLIIILSSWAIVQYVLTAFVDAMSGTSGVSSEDVIRIAGVAAQDPLL